jgi:manganese-dependent inorganic pyrophosphatase
VLKRAFAEKPPFRMILVDHNETAQGIPRSDEIPVIEVVDHHRVSFSPTAEPIRYTADVVGSTCTIVARLYRAAGLRPSKPIAGLLLAGLVSDTLLFLSPTTTDTDRTVAAWLEKISGLTAQDLMDGMMSVGSALTACTPAQAIESDRKQYREHGHAFSLAQIEETNLASFHEKRDSLRAELERLRAAENLDFIALLVTDPVRGRSELLYCGTDAVRRALPWRMGRHGLFDLPGVLSRKKQLLPAILSCLP